MAIKDQILEILNTKRAYYKGIPVNILGLPIFKNKNPKSVRNQCCYLIKEGLITTEDKNLILTKKGRIFLKNKILKKSDFNFYFDKDAQKDLLVMYDIPEDKKPEREWFRRHLIKFGYVMIQRSVWVGPSPLPKDFIDYVKKIGLKDDLKTFKLARGYKEK